MTDAVPKDSTATFTPGVSERRGATTTFSHSGLKNVDAQTGVTQAVNATQQYDAFGNLASSTGTWQGQFGYGGGFGYQQDATGLKLLGHRYYDASTGRFLTRDPIKDGRNWYVYCDGDSVNRIDSTGLEWHDPVQVSVDKDFRGKVWVVGEPGPGKEQVFVQVLPGRNSAPGMDVDLVIIQHPNGRQERYFLPGTSSPLDPNQVSSTYAVGPTGAISAVQNPPTMISYRLGIGLPSIRVPIPALPVLTPKGFGPKPAGGYPQWPFGGTGNWNDDIEAAKRRRS